MTVPETNFPNPPKPVGPAPARSELRPPDLRGDLHILRSELSAAQAAFDEGRAAEAGDLLQRLMPRIESASSRYARLGSADLAAVRLLGAAALALQGDVSCALGDADAGQAALTQAIAEFEEWLPRAGRRTSQALAAYALALEAAGRHENAVGALEQAVAQGSVSAPAYLLLARHRQAQGDLDAAAELCRQSLDVAPDSLDAQQTLAEILEAQGQTADALVNYHRTVNLLAAAGRGDDALAVAEHILALAPDDIDGLVVYGELLRLRGEPEKALAALDHALALDPTNREALAKRGAVLITLGRTEEALASLDAALTFDPKSAWALSVKGDALRLLGRNKEALAVLEEALALGEDDAWTLDTLAQVLLALGRGAEAVTVLRRAAEAYPQLAWVQAELAAALREAGQLDEALAAADRAWAVDPGDPELLKLRIDILQRLPRFEDALKALDDVLAQNADDANALWLRGDTLRQMGQYEDALAALDRALALAPANAQCLGSRGLVLRALGEDRKAAGALLKAA